MLQQPISAAMGSWFSSGAAPEFDISALPPISDDITVTSVDDLADGSAYIKPKRMTFSHNGRVRRWDLLDGHDAVAVMLHNTTSDTIVLVRQFRPPIYHHRAASTAGDTACGFTLEVRRARTSAHALALPLSTAIARMPAKCRSPGDTWIPVCVAQLPAGLIDKSGKSPEQIAAEECFEEAGYQVQPADLQLVTTVYGSVGLKSGSLQIYFAQVSDSHVVPGAGGGLREEGEFLDVIHMPVSALPGLMRQSDIPLPTGLFGALLRLGIFENILISVNGH